MRAKLTCGMAALSLCLLLPTAAHADAFFVTVFGAQRPVIKLARYSHSFATFVHVAANGCAEECTISWMPQAGKLRPFALMSEPGRNFTLNETLQFCVDNGMGVAAWGPYQIQPQLWNMALAQKGRLDSGQVAYKAFDYGAPEGRVSNCVHAVADTVRPPCQKAPAVIVAPANWGESGSYWATLTLRPWFVEPCQTHPWVLQRMGLNPCAFALHDLSKNPTGNPLVLVTQATLHAYLLPNRVQCGK
jgi:hypothetical protein